MKTRQKVEVGRQHPGMDRPRVRQVQEGSEEQKKMEETVCEVICGVRGGDHFQEQGQPCAKMAPAQQKSTAGLPQQWQCCS